MGLIKNRITLSRLMLLLVPVFLIQGCLAADPVTQGRNKSQMCAGCHGKNGRAEIPMYPNLAGQNALYIEMTLKAYRDGTRQGVQASAMYAISQGLSDEDIKHLAAYYSSLK